MPGSGKHVRRRSILSGLTLGTFSVLLTAPGTAAAVPSGAGAARVRAASFNIRHGTSPDDVLDLERTCEVIAALDVDVVGLQEVDRWWERSGFTDQPDWLARQLGMSLAFGANLTSPAERRGYPDREYGTAILSRFPIDKAHNLQLPTRPNAEPRGLLRTRLLAGDVPFIFATTHLSHDNDQERLAQAEAIVKSLRDTKRPVLLCGDFNDEPGSPPVSAMTGVYRDSWSGTGARSGDSFPSSAPDRRIDYIVASSGIDTVSTAVATADPGASDHLPVRGEFMVRG